MPVNIAAIGVGAVGSIFGASEAAAERKRQRRILAAANARLDTEQAGVRNREDALKAWYEGENAKNYIDTPEARAALSSLRTNQREASTRLADTSAITGASEEMQLANMANQNANVAGTMNQLAGQGTQYKRGLRGEMYQQRGQLDNLNQSIEGRRSALTGQSLGLSQNAEAGWNQFSQNALGGAASAYSDIGGWEGLKSTLKGKSAVAPSLNTIAPLSGTIPVKQPDIIR